MQEYMKRISINIPDVFSSAPPTELNQYGETPDTNYHWFGTGRFFPTDGSQLATWLLENTWVAAWSWDAVSGGAEINEGEGGGAILEVEKERAEVELTPLRAGAQQRGGRILGDAPQTLTWEIWLLYISVSEMI